MIELLNNYVIDEIGKQFVLKQKYKGMRKGKKTDCYRIVSYHKTSVSALQAFSDLLKTQLSGNSLISIDEYINRLKSENTRLIEAIQESKMERFYMERSKNDPGNNKYPIIDYLKFGKDNAISRESLVYCCVRDGLISVNTKQRSQDRQVRKLIEKARKDYVILNLSNGEGYYIATPNDVEELEDYVKQETRRCISIFRSISMAKKLLEDYKKGRIAS